MDHCGRRSSVAEKRRLHALGLWISRVFVTYLEGKLSDDLHRLEVIASEDCNAEIHVGY